MTLTDRMLAENAAVFDAMVRHRFVTDIAADRLPAAVFDRYLVFEGAFVDTAIAIFAHGVAKAPDIESKRWLIAVLDALANQQIAYFEAAFAARHLDPAGVPESAAVSAFRDRMRAIAEQGGYLDILTAMFAAEWMYWTWCRAVASRPVSDPILRDWIDLHAAEDFGHQAHWLRARLDAADATLAEADRVRLSALFGEVQRLEIAFHDAPYGD